MLNKLRLWIIRKLTRDDLLRFILISHRQPALRDEVTFHSSLDEVNEHILEFDQLDTDKANSYTIHTVYCEYNILSALDAARLRTQKDA